MRHTAIAPTRVLAFALAMLAAYTQPALSKELVVATVRASDDTDLDFRLTGAARDDVVGGEIVFGQAVYEISRVSRHGLIGARRIVSTDDGRVGEFVVFSSSFGSQTAVGTPWVAAREVRHCDHPYNAFLVVYRVEGDAAVASLGKIPYPTLVEDVDRSQQSRVYCFMGRPGAQ